MGVAVVRSYPHLAELDEPSRLLCVQLHLKERELGRVERILLRPVGVHQIGERAPARPRCAGPGGRGVDVCEEQRRGNRQGRGGGGGRMCNI